HRGDEPLGPRALRRVQPAVEAERAGVHEQVLIPESRTCTTSAAKSASVFAALAVPGSQPTQAWPSHSASWPEVRVLATGLPEPSTNRATPMPPTKVTSAVSS